MKKQVSTRERSQELTVLSLDLCQQGENYKLHKLAPCLKEPVHLIIAN
jgi:hypothetical protein